MLHSDLSTPLQWSEMKQKAQLHETLLQIVRVFKHTLQDLMLLHLKTKDTNIIRQKILNR